MFFSRPALLEYPLSISQTPLGLNLYPLVLFAPELWIEINKALGSRRTFPLLNRSLLSIHLLIAMLVSFVQNISLSGRRVLAFSVLMRALLFTKSRSSISRFRISPFRAP